MYYMSMIVSHTDSMRAMTLPAGMIFERTGIEFIIVSMLDPIPYTMHEVIVSWEFNC